TTTQTDSSPWHDPQRALDDEEPPKTIDHQASDVGRGPALGAERPPQAERQHDVRRHADTGKREHPRRLKRCKEIAPEQEPVAEQGKTQRVDPEHGRSQERRLMIKKTALEHKLRDREA